MAAKMNGQCDKEYITWYQVDDGVSPHSSTERVRLSLADVDNCIFIDADEHGDENLETELRKCNVTLSWDQNDIPHKHTTTEEVDKENYNMNTRKHGKQSKDKGPINGRQKISKYNEHSTDKAKKVLDGFIDNATRKSLSHGHGGHYVVDPWKTGTDSNL